MRREKIHHTKTPLSTISAPNLTLRCSTPLCKILQYWGEIFALQTKHYDSLDTKSGCTAIICRGEFGVAERLTVCALWESTWLHPVEADIVPGNGRWKTLSIRSVLNLVNHIMKQSICSKYLAFLKMSVSRDFHTTLLPTVDFFDFN